ncbi:glutamate receptor 2.2, putative [Medicago truncatula]|uniref:Glutamate receptor 2.2, putative n=1 Tax=Medicago truncatula TaxID=3880 RepID=G7JNN7_MEDTR|nr:glutamate receptor 2.2, putative [Medicago truncatula]
MVMTKRHYYKKEIVFTIFIGLSGEIQFKLEQLLQNPTLRIVNVDGKSYRELDFWTLENGFFTNISTEQVKNGLLRAPKGWNLPTKQKPMRIAFSKFIKIDITKIG